MRFEEISREEAQQKLGVRLTPEELEEFGKALDTLEASPGKAFKVVLGEGDMYASLKAKLRKFGASRGVDIRFKKQGNNSFSFWVLSEQEWEARPAGKKASPPTRKKR